MSESTHLNDCIYAKVSNNMVGLELNDGDTDYATIWLNAQGYKALKTLAQRLNWEPKTELAKLPPKVLESPLIKDLTHRAEYEQVNLNKFIANSNLQAYVEIEAKIREALSSIESVAIYWNGYSVNITFTGPPGFLAKTFRILRTHGFELTNDRPGEKFSFYSGKFVKALSDSEDEKLRITIYYTSSVCQMQVIRTELKEVPVYDMVCNEGLTEVDREELAQKPPAPLPVATPTSTSAYDNDIPF